jgi:hypothetical protein
LEVEYHRQGDKDDYYDEITDHCPEINRSLELYVIVEDVDKGEKADI